MGFQGMDPGIITPLRPKSKCCRSAEGVERLQSGTEANFRRRSAPLKMLTEKRMSTFLTNGHLRARPKAFPRLKAMSDRVLGRSRMASPDLEEWGAKTWPPD